MDKKRRIKEGKKLGIFVTVIGTVSSFTSQLFNHETLTLKNTIFTIVSALITGCVAGLLNFWLLKKYGNNERLLNTAKINLAENETILFEAPANHFKGIEAVGRKLCLTNKRLVFQSHKFNFKNHQLSMPLSNIAEVNRYKTLGITNTGLSITTADNVIEKFVVQQPAEWIKQLKEWNGLLQI